MQKRRCICRTGTFGSDDRGAALVAFMVAGLVALVTAYLYTRLPVTYPSQGGTVTFIDQAFGSGLFTGSSVISPERFC